MNRAARRRSQARGRKLQAAVEEMTGGTFTALLVTPTTALMLLVTGDPQDLRHVICADNFLTSTESLATDSKPICATCPAALHARRDIAGILSIIPNPVPPGTQIMAMAICRACYAKHPNNAEAQKAMMVVVKDGIWPDLREINVANMSSESGRA